MWSTSFVSILMIHFVALQQFTNASNLFCVYSFLRDDKIQNRWGRIHTQCKVSMLLYWLTFSTNNFTSVIGSVEELILPRLSTIDNIWVSNKSQKVYFCSMSLRLQWCWWPRYVGDFMMATESICWRLFHYIGDFWMNRIGHQHLWSVTGIAKLSRTHFVSNIRPQHPTT